MDIQTFNAALAGIHTQPILNEVAFQQLVTTKGEAYLTRVISAAGQGEERSIKALQCLGQATGLLASLLQMRFVGMTYAHAYQLLRQHGLAAVRKVVGEALHGVPTARNQISAWLGEVSTLTAPPEPALRVAGSNVVAPTFGADSLPPPLGEPVQFVPVSQPGQNAAPGATRPVAMPAATVMPATTSGYSGHADAGAADAGYAQPSSPMADEVTGPRTYDDAKAYGARAALTFAADTTRANEPTVCIEAAEGANRKYRWNEKIRFQLTHSERDLLIALLYRDIESLHFSNHDDKWMSAGWQGDQYAGTIKFTLGKGKAADNRPRTVQVDYTAHPDILGVFLRQAAKAHHCGENEVRQRVRTAALMYQAATAARAPRAVASR